MLKRKSYLSNKALNFYLLSTILATMSTSLGVVVDGVIVGQLMGVNALSAISLCVPVIQLLATLMMLLNIGNALMLSISKGRGLLLDSKQYYSFALLLNGFASLILVVVGLLFSKDISHLLTSETILQPMVEEYVHIVLISTPLYLLLPALGIFVRTDGFPTLTTIALLVANCSNLLLDVVFIKYLELGVAGSAYATSCGYLIGVVIFVYHIRSSKSSLSFTTSLSSIDKEQALTLALPFALTSSLMTLRILGVNYIVEDNLGTMGLGQMAVCFNLLMLVSMFVTGVSQSIQPVSGFMIGQRDYQGFTFVAKRALTILICIVGVSVALFEFFPESVLKILGFKDMELIAESSRVVQIVAISFILYATNYLLMVIYQLSGHTKFSLFISISQPLAVLPVMYGLATISSDNLWWSFLIGEASVLLVCVIYSIYHKLKNAKLNTLTLISTNESSKILDLSISNTVNLDFSHFINQLNEFLAKNGVDKRVKYHIELCCDELLSNIMRYAYNSRGKHYIDVNVNICTDNILLSIKDDGFSFNPLEHKESGNIGLLIVKGVCKDISYQRINGQNMVFIKILNRGNF